MSPATTTSISDADERDRIEHTGLAETLFVEAGAGTGKTHELVERVVNLVLVGGVRLRDIAAITFTEAAAAELRDRIREAFEKRADETAEVEKRTTYRQAVADVDEAAIGTLHAFCLRILSEHPLAVGLPPRVAILDEVSSQLAFERRWERFVDVLHTEPEAEELVLRAWAVKVRIESRSGLAASFKDVASVFNDNWDRLDAVADEPLTPLPAPDWSGLERAVAALAELPGKCRDEGDRLLALVRGIGDEAQLVLTQQDALRRLVLVRQYVEGWKAGNAGVKKNWDDKPAAQAAVNAVGEAANAIVASASDAVLRGLSARLARFTREAAEERRAEGRLEFHDLLVLARRLVRTSDETCTSLPRRYTRLLLDEFQDTDPIQIEVAVRIARARTTPALSLRHRLGSAGGRT